MSRYERRYFNCGRRAGEAGLAPLPPEPRRAKARRAYLAGYAAATQDVVSNAELDALRRIAEAADRSGLPWEWQGGYPQRITRVGDVIVVADCFEDPDSPSRFAEFIAAFDPPTVLALLARPSVSLTAEEER